MSKKISALIIIIVFLIISNDVSASSLSDLSGHKNETAIEYLNDNEVISGYPDGTFQPNKTINRAELLKILVGGKGITPTLEEYKNCFPDISEEWFAPYVCYAKQQNWVGGYPDGTFQPGKAVNKVEAIKMLVSSQGYIIPTEATVSTFNDVDLSQWYAPYIEVAKNKELLEEVEGNFGVTSEMTRAGISENIYRAMIVKENNLKRFSEYSEEKDIIANDTDNETRDEEIIQISSLSFNAFWRSWDSDAEEDGFKLSTYFKNEDGESVYPKVKDWTVKIEIYKAETDYSKYGDFSTHKLPTLLHSLSFIQNEIKYDSINLPYVQVAEEKVPKLIKGLGYVWIEATFTSEKQGTFSASEDYVSFYKNS